MRRRKILVISYLFPPFGGVGVQRALSFARYLPAHGCEVFVVTARNAGTAVTDPGLLDLVPAEVHVHRTFTPEIPFHVRKRLWSKLQAGGSGVPPPASSTAQPRAGKSLLLAARQSVGSALERVFSPDLQIVWAPFARRAAARLIREHSIDAVVATVPPFSVLDIGVALKRQFPSLTLISDFRDEWLGYWIGAAEGVSQYRRRSAIRIEKRAVAASDFVVSVTPSWTQRLRDRYPEEPGRKFVCISNGFDPDAMRHFHPRTGNGAGIVIAYMGTVHANPVYSARTFLEAVDGLPDAVRDKLVIRFVGRVLPEEMARMDASRARVERLGFLPQAEAFRALEDADYLLLIVNDATAHAGKLFEYMATGKPILALTPENGEIARVLRETGAGWCADPSDAGAIRALMMKLCGNDSARPPFQPDRAAIAQYNRSTLAGSLARLAGA